jgi:hypothetical protein
VPVPVPVPMPTLTRPYVPTSVRRPPSVVEKHRC